MAEVHVVGYQGTPVRSQRAADSPVITAGEKFLADLARRRRFPGILAQRENLRRRPIGFFARLSRDRGIPASSLRIEPVVDRPGKRAIGRATAHVVARALVVEFDKHRIDDQD
jgi:hypothetical protein